MSLPSIETVEGRAELRRRIGTPHFEVGQSLLQAIDVLDVRDAALAEARAALKPFARLADTWTVQTAAQSGTLLTVSNGQRMCGIDADAFIRAAAAIRDL
jgi:hypothetical protein